MVRGRKERQVLIWSVKANDSKDRKMVRIRMERQTLIESVKVTYSKGRKVVWGRMERQVLIWYAFLCFASPRWKAKGFGSTSSPCTTKTSDFAYLI